MVGFSESELFDMLSYYQSEGMLVDSIDDLVWVMKPWYDNYCLPKNVLVRRCITRIWFFIF